MTTITEGARVTIDGITYTGTRGSYRARRAGAECNVVHAGGRWTAWFYGSTKRNPVIIDEDGRRSRSCVCPRVDVAGDFCTRREAAMAGLAAAEEDGDALYPS